MVQSTDMYSSFSNVVQRFWAKCKFVWLDWPIFPFSLKWLKMYFDKVLLLTHFRTTAKTHLSTRRTHMKWNEKEEVNKKKKTMSKLNKTSKRVQMVCDFYQNADFRQQSWRSHIAIQQNTQTHIDYIRFPMMVLVLKETVKWGIQLHKWHIVDPSTTSWGIHPKGNTTTPKKFNQNIQLLLEKALELCPNIRPNITSNYYVLLNTYNVIFLCRDVNVISTASHDSRYARFWSMLGHIPNAKMYSIKQQKIP